MPVSLYPVNPSDVPKVAGFRGDYEFLSNFYPSPIEVDGISYPTVEHAYQAAKSISSDIRKTIAALSTPGKAKRYGQKISPLPQSWDFDKQSIMQRLLVLKFSDPVLKQKLIDTEPMNLEETNSWGDTYWGVCNGVGQNVLGGQLMSLRYNLAYPSKGIPVDIITFDDFQNKMNEDSKTVDAA